VARDDIAPGIRHLVSGEYLTLYRLTGGAVEIIRVLRSTTSTNAWRAGF
jgi:toxin ParE1/3/4